MSHLFNDLLNRLGDLVLVLEAQWLANVLHRAEILVEGDDCHLLGLQDPVLILKLLVSVLKLFGFNATDILVLLLDRQNFSLGLGSGSSFVVEVSLLVG